MTYRKKRNGITAAPRRKRRVPANRRKPNYSLLFLIFFFSVLVSGAVGFALSSPDLVVEEVKIDGVQICSREAVKAAAEKALGKNIICLRKSPILAEISSLPEVDQVKMGRSFPDKVWVRIWERKPDAVLNCSNTYYLIQQDGLVFHKCAAPERGTTLVCVADGGSIKVGQKASSGDVRHALKVLEALRGQRLTAAKISVDPEGDICLNMGSDFYVKLGQPEEIGRKVSLLQRVLSWEPSIAQKARYLDFSCPSAPVWKPKTVAQAAP